MQKRTVKARLLSGGECIAETVLTAGCQAIEAGRSHSCVLRTPAEDQMVSAHHARIYWKGRSLYLADLQSRNGTFLYGRRLEKPVKISFGTYYAIGNYRIVFEEQNVKKRVRRDGFHRLQYMSGDAIGKMVEIKPRNGAARDEFTVGLDPSSDLRLCDASVSRRHAVFKLRPGGECWIEDLGSRNGTFVNGEQVKKERLLKHRDKISIAYFELMFHDKRYPDPNPHIWAKLVAIAVTAAVLALAYAVYLWTLPVADTFFSQARAFAVAEKFSAAARALDEVERCRDATTDSVRERLEIERASLAAWTSTCEGWKRVRALLADGAIRDARKNLAILLHPAARSGWTWNSDAEEIELRKAEFAGNILDLLYEAKDMVESAEAKVLSKDRLVALSRRLDDALADKDARLASAPYLSETANAMAEFSKSLHGILQSVDEVDAIVEGMNASTDIGETVEKLRNVAKSGKSASLRGHAAKIVPVMEKLAAAQDALEKELADICDMNFANVVRAAGKDALELPGVGECAISPKASDIRREMLERHEKYVRIAANLMKMTQVMEASGMRDGNCGALVNYVTSKKEWEKVLAFDCFAPGAKFPNASRADPTSVYDEMVCIEYTRDILQRPPDQPIVQMDLSGRFPAKVQEAVALFGQVRLFVDFMNKKEMSAGDLARLKSGKLGRLYTLSADVLARRDALIAWLRAKANIAKSRGNMDRAQIIAGLYAEYFSDEPSYPNRRTIQNAYTALGRTVKQLKDRYDSESDPEERMKLAGKILDTGIPGMATVREVWVKSGVK